VKEAIADTVKSIKEEGVTVLLVEQDAGLAFVWPIGFTCWSKEGRPPGTAGKFE